MRSKRHIIVNSGQSGLSHLPILSKDDISPSAKRIDFRTGLPYKLDPRLTSELFFRASNQAKAIRKPVMKLVQLAFNNQTPTPTTRPSDDFSPPRVRFPPNPVDPGAQTANVGDPAFAGQDLDWKYIKENDLDDNWVKQEYC